MAAIASIDLSVHNTVGHRFRWMICRRIVCMLVVAVTVVFVFKGLIVVEASASTWGGVAFCVLVRFVSSLRMDADDNWLDQTNYYYLGKFLSCIDVVAAANGHATAVPMVPLLAADGGDDLVVEIRRVYYHDASSSGWIPHTTITQSVIMILVTAAAAAAAALAVSTSPLLAASCCYITLRQQCRDTI